MKLKLIGLITAVLWSNYSFSKSIHVITNAQTDHLRKVVVHGQYGNGSNLNTFKSSFEGTNFPFIGSSNYTFEIVNEELVLDYKGLGGKEYKVPVGKVVELDPVGKQDWYHVVNYETDNIVQIELYENNSVNFTVTNEDGNCFKENIGSNNTLLTYDLTSAYQCTIKSKHLKILTDQGKFNLVVREHIKRD